MMLMQFRSMRRVARTLMSVGLATLAACASPPTRFYTLGIDLQPNVAGDTASPSFRIDVRPVKVPAAVARSQLVVQINAAQVQVLEDDRWASSLPDEIRAALIAGVSQQAGAPAAKTLVPGEDVPVYEVTVDIQRFESWPGSHVLVDGVWTVSRSTIADTLTCHSVVSEPVSDGYQAVAGGHRRAMSVVAAQIAKAIRAFPASGADSPSRPDGASGTAGKRGERGERGKRALSCPHATDSVQTAADSTAPRVDE